MANKNLGKLVLLSTCGYDDSWSIIVLNRARPLSDLRLKTPQCPPSSILTWQTGQQAGLSSVVFRLSFDAWSAAQSTSTCWSMCVIVLRSGCSIFCFDCQHCSQNNWYNREIW